MYLYAFFPIYLAALQVIPRLFSALNLVVIFNIYLYAIFVSRKFRQIALLPSMLFFFYIILKLLFHRISIELIARFSTYFFLFPFVVSISFLPRVRSLSFFQIYKMFQIFLIAIFFLNVLADILPLSVWAPNAPVDFSHRSYGFALQPSISSSFTIISSFYFWLVFGKLISRWTLFFLVLNVLFVVITCSSGVGFLILALAICLVLVKYFFNAILHLRKSGRLSLVGLILLFSAVISLGSLGYYSITHTTKFDTLYIDYLVELKLAQYSSVELLLDIPPGMYYQFNKYFGVDTFLGFGSDSSLALLFNYVGIVGCLVLVFSYLYCFFFVAKPNFPLLFSFTLLTISSLHYPVLFIPQAQILLLVGCLPSVVNSLTYRSTKSV